jgi:hypothetical protein
MHAFYTRTEAAKILGITFRLFSLLEDEGQIPTPNHWGICPHTGLSVPLWTKESLLNSRAAKVVAGIRRDNPGIGFIAP